MLKNITLQSIGSPHTLPGKWNLQEIQKGSPLAEDNAFGA